jgi:hypothetical protein
VIIIDGTSYDVPLTAKKRKAEMLYKYAERTQDGVLHSELIGVYVNYDCSVGMSANNVSDYAALYLKLTEPVVSHSIVMLGVTFDCYFAGINDEVVRERTEADYFRNLSFSIIAISPTRTPA